MVAAVAPCLFGNCVDERNLYIGVDDVLPMVVPGGSHLVL